MKTARLYRTDQTPSGTFGLFVTAGGWWYSMELPWKDNEPFVSCIPEGTYECHYTHSETFGRKTFILGHVNDRSGIRIHVANRVEELQGCIALGNRFDGHDPHLLRSGPAIDALHQLMGGAPFELIIQKGLVHGTGN